MKKSILFIVAAGMLSLMSCKKDHTCTCTYQDVEAQNHTFEKTSKKEAKEACDQLSAISALGNGSCELK